MIAELQGMRSCRPTFRGAQAAPRHSKLVRLRARFADDKTDSPLLKNIEFINPIWKNIESKEQFTSVLKAEVDAGRCPDHMYDMWVDFFDSFKKAVIGSNQIGGNEKLAAQVSLSTSLPGLPPWYPAAARELCQNEAA